MTSPESVGVAAEHDQSLTPERFGDREIAGCQVHQATSVARSSESGCEGEPGRGRVISR
jgi:hypothetical protein